MWTIAQRQFEAGKKGKVVMTRPVTPTWHQRLGLNSRIPLGEKHHSNPSRRLNAVNMNTIRIILMD